MPEPRTPSSEEAGHREFPTYRRGRWWPVFAILFLPFIILFRFLYPAIKHEINWRAMIATILYFEIFMLFAEHYNLKRGHWVYNEARIFGPKIFGIPIEEPLIYYWFPGLVVIAVMLAIRRKLKGGAKL